MVARYNCPRCHAVVEVGQTACERCGLALDPADANLPFQGAVAPLPHYLAPQEQPKRRLRAAIGLGIFALLMAVSVAAGMAQIGRADRFTAEATAVAISARATAQAEANLTALAQPSNTAVPPPPTQEPPTPTTLVPIEESPTPEPTQTPEPTAEPTPEPPTPEPTQTPEPPLPPTQEPPPPTQAPPPPPPATNTSAPPRPTATRRPPPPTATRRPPRPTATRRPPAPTPTPIPGVGGTLPNFVGWTVYLSKVEQREELDAGVRYTAVGTFWLLWVEARNNGNSTRSLGETVDFVLTDAKGSLYAELSGHGVRPGEREFAKRLGQAYLNAPVSAGERTGTVLVFDLPEGTRPVRLTGRRIVSATRVSGQDQAWFDLTKR